MYNSLLKLTSNFILKKEKDDSSTGTELPYFEFLFEKFENNDAKLLRKISRKQSAPLPILTAEEREKILSSSYGEETKSETDSAGTPKASNHMMIPKIQDESQILNLEQFTELINSVPRLYQTLEWKLIYSTAVSGTSYHNLLRHAKNNGPNIVVIKDEHDFVFGVYCSSGIWFSNDYYGSGETFLFTFRVLLQPN